MSNTYKTIEEIISIYGIPLKTAEQVIKKSKIDHFTNKGKTYLHVKDFYKAYTKKYNPSLFDTKK